MGRLCGGAHEISGIKAPTFSPWWVVGGFLGWVGGWCCGWVGVVGVGHRVRSVVVVGWVMGWVGVWVGDGAVGPHDTPIKFMALFTSYVWRLNPDVGANHFNGEILISIARFKTP